MKTQKNCALIGLDNDLKMLRNINRFIFLRASEAAKLVWPEKEKSKGLDSAYNSLSKLLLKEFIVRRRLPENAGYAYVLNKNGAKFLQCHQDSDDLPAKSRENWGKFSKTQSISLWSPPDNWKHHLLSASILAEFNWKNDKNKHLDSEYIVLSELEFRHIYSDKISSGLIRKIPDGVVIDKNRKSAHFLETELSAKFGENMNKLAESIILPELNKLFGIKLGPTIVGFDIYQTTIGNHSLNHEKNLISSVSRKLSEINKNLINHYFFKAELSGRSIINYEFVENFTQRNDITFITQQRKNMFNQTLTKLEWEEFEGSHINQLYTYRSRIDFEQGYHVYRLYKLVQDNIRFPYANGFVEIEIKSLSGQHKDLNRAKRIAERKLCRLCVDYEQHLIAINKNVFS